jgi:hypothetical protein
LLVLYMRCFVLGIRQFGGVCKTMCWSGRAGIYGMWPDDIYSICKDRPVTMRQFE